MYTSAFEPVVASCGRSSEPLREEERWANETMPQLPEEFEDEDGSTGSYESAGSELPLPAVSFTGPAIFVAAALALSTVGLVLVAGTTILRDHSWLDLPSPIQQFHMADILAGPGAGIALYGWYRNTSRRVQAAVMVDFAWLLCIGSVVRAVGLAVASTMDCPAHWTGVACVMVTIPCFMNAFASAVGIVTVLLAGLCLTT